MSQDENTGAAPGLALIEADFRDAVGLRKGMGKALEMARHVGPVGASVGEGNKYAVTRLWTDGLFVYIESAEYIPRAVPCSNVVSVGMVPPPAVSPPTPKTAAPRQPEPAPDLDDTDENL